MLELSLFISGLRFIDVRIEFVYFRIEIYRCKN